MNCSLINLELSNLPRWWSSTILWPTRSTSVQELCIQRNPCTPWQAMEALGITIKSRTHDMHRRSRGMVVWTCSYIGGGCRHARHLSSDSLASLCSDPPHRWWNDFYLFGLAARIPRLGVPQRRTHTGRTFQCGILSRNKHGLWSELPSSSFSCKGGKQ